MELILQKRNQDVFISLEKEGRKILIDLLAIYKKMSPSSFLSTLLKEKIKNFYLLDIPSFPLGWSIFGEISSILFIISSCSNDIHRKPLEKFLEQIQEYPIFLILLKDKKI